MSNKKEREKRREERIAAETKVSSTDQRTKMLQIGAGLAFLVIVAVVAVIVINSSSNGSSGDTKLENVATVNQILGDIPQEGLVIGDPKAPVELIEFGDLQCPVCKGYSEEQLPPLIDGVVKEGKAKIAFRNFTIISEESIPAGAAAIAAGNQGRGWNYIDIFYRNQGKERTGYVTDEFMTSIAKGAGVKDIAKWNKERKSKDVLGEVEATTAEATKFGFNGTPSFAIKGPGTNGIHLLPTLSSTGEFEAAIKEAS
jgi:protein-disulfide isomerase